MGYQKKSLIFIILTKSPSLFEDRVSKKKSLILDIHHSPPKSPQQKQLFWSETNEPTLGDSALALSDDLAQLQQTDAWQMAFVMGFFWGLTVSEHSEQLGFFMISPVRIPGCFVGLSRFIRFTPDSNLDGSSQWQWLNVADEPGDLGVTLCWLVWWTGPRLGSLVFFLSKSEPFRNMWWLHFADAMII